MLHGRLQEVHADLLELGGTLQKTRRKLAAKSERLRHAERRCAPRSVPPCARRAPLRRAEGRCEWLTCRWRTRAPALRPHQCRCARRGRAAGWRLRSSWLRSICTAG